MAEAPLSAAAIRAAVSQANAHVTDFYKIIDLTEDDFRKWAASRDAVSVGDLLGVGDTFTDAVIRECHGNCTLGWSGLRGIFGRPWIKRLDMNVFDRLFSGKVACAYCHGTNAKAVLLSAKANVLDRHAEHADHVKRVSAGQHRQLEIREAGMQTSAPRADRLVTARQLVIARLVAGIGGKGHGAAGLPPTSIPGLFDADMLLVSNAQIQNVCLISPLPTCATCRQCHSSQQGCQPIRLFAKLMFQLLLPPLRIAFEAYSNRSGKPRFGFLSQSTVAARSW